MNDYFVVKVRHEGVWLYQSGFDNDDLTPFRSNAARFDIREEAIAERDDWIAHTWCSCVARVRRVVR